jgi:hypothetical protein
MRFGLLLLAGNGVVCVVGKDVKLCVTISSVIKRVM